MKFEKDEGKEKTKQRGDEQFRIQLVRNQQELSQVLNCLLPQIERQLLKDIERQLEMEFEEKFLQKVHRIQDQAQTQFNQAIKELQGSRNLLEEQKLSEIVKEIQILQSALQTLTEEHLLKLQQNFLEQNFDSKVMAHTRIIDMQNQIQQEIFTYLEQKHQLTKQRQLKELIITHQTKEIKIRKELDAQIKSRIYFSSGLQELKQEIKQSRTQMGSQKSDYNLRLKKIQSQIKEYQDKIKQINRLPSLQQLEKQYQALKIQLLEVQTQYELKKNKKLPEKIGNINQNEEETIENYTEKDPLEFSHLHREDYQQNQFYQMSNFSQPNFDNNNSQNTKSLKRQQKNHRFQQNNNQHNQHFVNAQQHLQNINTKKSSSPLYQNSQQNQSLHQKINLTTYFNNYLNQYQTNQQNNPPFDNQYSSAYNNQTNTLLNFKNISHILKEKITQDPLQKYLQSSQKQNFINSNNINSNKQSKSNFKQLYQQHLKNLNKSLPKKNTKKVNPTGLSNMAKKAIIKNLAQYHKNYFECKMQQNNFECKMQQNNFRIPSYNYEESENQNTYQTDLLAGNN